MTILLPITFLGACKREERPEKTPREGAVLSGSQRTRETVNYSFKTNRPEKAVFLRVIHTRRSSKGPELGDLAVSQEARQEREVAEDGPKETKPSSTADLTGRAEKEVEVLKETTTMLEQEVRILRGFAQDTLELLKELREERLGARQPQTVPSYYAAQDTASLEKSTLQGAGASAALYGARGLWPSREHRRLHCPLHSTELLATPT